jgi:hypothetical protein
VQEYLKSAGDRVSADGSKNFPIFGLTAVLKILSFPALASGDNIAD